MTSPKGATKTTAGTDRRWEKVDALVSHRYARHLSAVLAEAEQALRGAYETRQGEVGLSPTQTGNLEDLTDLGVQLVRASDPDQAADPS
jgi:hypothetical protein